MKKYLILIVTLFSLATYAQGGINIATGFKLNDPQPLDDRSTPVADFAALSSIHDKCDGLIVKTLDTGKYYGYDADTDAWIEIGSGGATDMLTKTEGANTAALEFDTILENGVRFLLPSVTTAQDYPLVIGANQVQPNGGGMLFLGMNDIALQDQPVATNIPFAEGADEYKIFKDNISAEGNYQYLTYGDNFVQLGVSTSVDPNDGSSLFVTTTAAVLSSPTVTLNATDNISLNASDRVELTSPDIRFKETEGSYYAGILTDHLTGDKQHYLPDNNGTYAMGVSIGGGTPVYAGNNGVISLASTVTQTITNGVTTTSPSEDAVFDAFAGKVSTTGNEIIGGIKTFSTAPVVGTASPGTSNTSAASHGFATAGDNAIYTYIANNLPKNIIVDTVDSSTWTSSTSESTALKSYLIPANALATGTLELYASTTKTGSSGTTDVKVYYNTTNSLSGATQIAATVSGTASRNIPLSRTFNIKADNTINGFGFTTAIASDAANSNLALSSASFTPSTAYYILITLTNSSATDTSTIKAVQLKFNKSI